MASARTRDFAQASQWQQAVVQARKRNGFAKSNNHSQSKFKRFAVMSRQHEVQATHNANKQDRVEWCNGDQQQRQRAKS
ncbi:hypothetical protein Dimus_035382, partial [Dionaea muscipula]